MAFLFRADPACWGGQVCVRLLEECPRSFTLTLVHLVVGAGNVAWRTLKLMTVQKLAEGHFLKVFNLYKLVHTATTICYGSNEFLEACGVVQIECQTRSIYQTNII